MEKKRRARINVSLEQLKSLLEKHYSHQIRKRKLEKADILELSVKYMKSLQSSLQGRGGGPPGGDGTGRGPLVESELWIGQGRLKGRRKEPGAGPGVGKRLGVGSRALEDTPRPTARSLQKPRLWTTWAPGECTTLDGQSGREAVAALGLGRWETPSRFCCAGPFRVGYGA
uniref:BHLH domain-containing protein n=1 Tax=Oryctolagus cuniculus TaxID=9986 RepID=G1U397_RABIT